MKQYTFLASTLSLCLLSACSVGTQGVSVGLGLGTSIGSNLGLGTSINIPVKFDKSQTANNSINTVDEQIISHFDAQGRTSNQAVKGGYYRQLLNKRGQEYIVQDFYSDHSRKRTDPYILHRNQLLQFHATPENGALITYSYDGHIMRQQIFQNNKLISSKY